MKKDYLELMQEQISKVSEEKLITTISKGALKLTDKQVDTVSFVFWLVYMAEIDLESVIKEAWAMAGNGFSDEVRQRANELIQEQYDGSRTININKLDFFIDKIVVLEALYGKNERVKMLYKLNDLRNDISHNRIHSLTYEGLSLDDRATKEKILIDYFETLTTKYNELNRYGN